MLTLLVLQGPDKGRRYELPDAPALVGRDSRQLPITDNTVSRRHCELLPTEEGSWILKDLGSSNGTYVNGTRVVRTYLLKLGDQIRVGRTLMVFGAQPGVSSSSRDSVNLAGQEAGMDSAIMHTVASNEDSMVLAVPEPAQAAMQNLRVLYQLGASLGRSFDADQVLAVVMDLIFEHVKADRGIILIVGKDKDELIPRVVRTRDETDNQPAKQPKSKEGRKDSAQSKEAAHGGNGHNGAAQEHGESARDDDDDPLAIRPDASGAPGVRDGEDREVRRAGSEKNEKIHASRTIINYVLDKGEGVLSSNAMTDQRFSKGKSVHNLGIRSALCVPIKARRIDGKHGDETLGVIYIDSSVKNYTYSQDQLRLLTAIGLQAGLAMQNAKLYSNAIQAERLAAIGETTAALSHSIKNILQALRGGADVVEMGLKSKNITQVSKGWPVVERNLDRIYNLTMNLLAYSKDREPRLQMVNPKALIDECVELIASRATEKGVMVVADVEPDHPAMPLDPDGMHQALVNLLANALDAVEAQAGLIRVVCRYDPRHNISVWQVIDNGSGIAPTMTAHLFELFHSTKGNRGTGLGLAVTKKIVEEHDGIVEVQSRPGEGTTFTIRLPAGHNKSPSPADTHGPPSIVRK